MRITLSTVAVIALLLVYAAPVALSLPSTWASDTIAQRGPSLKDELQKGLKARLPSEFAFVDRVVALVDAGRLPSPLVRSTFGWARRKKPYPFPYFQRAMVLRAAKIGVEIE
ncbi:MAG: hypothetical protein P8N76_13145 [Pirellulaceae bacterium]|nr:hypothetical protein [Pirellulaceae bacterium]